MASNIKMVNGVPMIIEEFDPQNRPKAKGTPKKKSGTKTSAKKKSAAKK